MLGVTCVEGHLSWRSLVLEVTCVGGRLCWGSLVLEGTCVGGHLYWRSLAGVVFFLSSLWVPEMELRSSGLGTRDFPTELAHHSHWIPSLPLNNLKIKFSTNEEMPFRAEYPSSDPPVDSQDASVIPGQCHPLCPPSLSHWDPSLDVLTL